MEAMDERRTAGTVLPPPGAFHREGRHPPSCLETAGLTAVHPGEPSRPGFPEGIPKEGDRNGVPSAGHGRVLLLAGEVRAGFPSPAEEELRDILSFDEYLVPFPDASFLVQARDDSMTGEGIRKGDLVIIERGRVPRHGDVVLAEAAWLLRYFCRERGRVVLRTADPTDSPVVPHSELRLGGVVTAVVRKYHK